MHQMQVEGTYSSEQNTSRKSGKTREAQEVRGESFKSILARGGKPEKVSVKKKSRHGDTKKKVPAAKEEQSLHRGEGVSSPPAAVKVPSKKVQKGTVTVKALKKLKKKTDSVKMKRAVKTFIPKEKKGKQDAGVSPAAHGELPPTGIGKKQQVTQSAARSSAVSGVPVAAGTVLHLSSPKPAKQNVKDKRGKASGVKKVSVLRGKEKKGTLRVIDLRSKKHSKIKGVQADPHHKDPGVEQDTKLSVSLPADKGEMPDAPRTPVPAATDAKAVLLRELQEKMNDRIVKESGIVLKDNSSGEIKLILEPESLGKVRIRLHLQDNHLTGKIFVDNPQVQEVFERNMQNLVKAFGDSGFSMTSLNVSVGDRGRGGRGQKEDQGNVTRALGIIENSIPVIGEYRYTDNVIDLVV